MPSPSAQIHEAFENQVHDLIGIAHLQINLYLRVSPVKPPNDFR